MIAFIDDFWMLQWLMILLIPLAFLVEPTLTRSAPPGAAAAMVD